MNTLRFLPMVLMIVSVAGCASGEPLRAIDRHVDLSRFMGAWYVLGSIPIFLEKGAHNGVESYQLNDKGEIATTYTFRKGAFDGPVKAFHPTGFVYNKDTNAEWRMQFLWPFRAAYLIIYLDDQYQRTIIGVPDRSYVWIMSRTPEIPEAEYKDLLRYLDSVGYDSGKIQRIPQQWPAQAPAVDAAK